MADLPLGVIKMMAQRARRMHHYLFHQTRNMWIFSDENTKRHIRELGWEPPRPARRPSANGRPQPITDNDSGEDFLYMHRQMIAGVNLKLAEIGDLAYPKIEGWSQIPRPDDNEYPVPPAWDTGDGGFNQFLNRVKSDEYFSQEFLD